MKRAALQRLLRGRHLFVVEDADGLWATDSYWLTPAAAVEELLDWWNLPLKPGAYAVDARVIHDARRSEKLPDVGALRRSTLDKKLSALTRLTLDGCALMVRNSGGDLCVLLERTDGDKIAVNADYLSVAVESSTSPTLAQAGTAAGPILIGDKGEAFVMPVRLS